MNTRVLSHSILEGLFSIVEAQILNAGSVIIQSGTANVKNPRWIKGESMISETLSILLGKLFWKKIGRLNIRDSLTLVSDASHTHSPSAKLTLFRLRLRAFGATACLSLATLARAVCKDSSLRIPFYV
jgi:hypothetical protein